MLFKVEPPTKMEEANVTATNLRMWHERLGHIGKRAIRELAKKGLVKGVSMSDKVDFFCEACQLGKAHRLPFKECVEKVSTKPGEKIHTDVCGPMSVESLGGARYFLTFKDDATGFRHVYFIKHKSDVFDRFKEFAQLIKNKFEKSIKVLRSDNGREFCNAKMDEYLAANGIKKENTAPYTPEQNGKAERDNRTIVESARTMLHSKNLPTFLWAEPINTAVYVLNRSASSGKIATPYELWVGKKPSLEYLRIFGSEAYVHVPKEFRRKLDVRAKLRVFVGYQDDSANYRVYDADTKKISVSRNVTFHEKTGKSNVILEHDGEEPIVLPRSESLKDEMSNNKRLK